MYKFSYFVPHLNLNGLGPVHTRFHAENASNVYRPHCAGGI